MLRVFQAHRGQDGRAVRVLREREGALSRPGAAEDVRQVP
jgi:hypothetical protein